MRKFLRGAFIVVVNCLVLIALLGAIELFYRLKSPTSPDEDATTNGLWQKYAPYVMFEAAPGSYSRWTNKFTGKTYQADVKTNSLGFNDPHEFSYDKPYQKASNERTVLFSGGSAAWGVGATAIATTVAGRTQYYLNSMQDKIRYTVINLGMAGYIAYQQYLALELWGESFDPDWVVMMDGYNDATVECQYSQGVGNPMYYAIIQTYVTSYLFSVRNPVFYRGWLENELIEHSVAYRTLTGKQYIPSALSFDTTSKETMVARRTIIPTKIGQSRDILAFYLKAEKATLGLFPKARYILSTQAIANQFTGDFVDVYASPSSSTAHRGAMAAREAALEKYLTQYQDQPCSMVNTQPSTSYIFVNGAIQLERLVDKERATGRDVAYYNTGTLFPDTHADRIPYFIDSIHLSDQGADAVGRFYAEKILSSDTLDTPLSSR
jgi:hypothetical protein